MLKEDSAVFLLVKSICLLLFWHIETFRLNDYVILLRYLFSMDIIVFLKNTYIQLSISSSKVS